MSAAIAETHAFKTEAAREFAVAKLELRTVSVTMHAATARYQQALAMLTYMENIEYALRQGE